MKKHLLLIFGFCLSFISLELVAQNTVVVTAFNDVNDNGIDDDGFIIPNITTGELYITDALANTYNHTEVTGVYTFTGLPDGDYTLHYIETPWTVANNDVLNPAYVITDLNVGGATMDNDVEPNSGVSAPFNITGSVTEMDIDLGLTLVSSIGNFVWEDVNGDGLQDAGEPALDGVTVTLLDGTGAGALDADGNPVANQITAGGGIYWFGNLSQGDYIVQFSLPTNGGFTWYATTFDVMVPDLANDSDADPTNLLRSPIYTIQPSIVFNEHIDAGFVVASSIGDMVWEDLNGDGVQDPGELGIDGVTVSLFDDLGNPAIGTDGLAIAPQVTATVLGIAGTYQFLLVPPGQYQVEFGLPAPIGGVNWYPTLFDPADVEPDNSDTDSDASNNPADGINYLRTAFIMVESGETDEEMRIDAGFWLPAKIGNNVFCDENGNGIDDDGVPGVGGINVELIDSNTGAVAQDADGNNLIEVSVNGGMYMFELVPPGEYFVQFSFPGAPGPADPPFTFTTQDQGTDDTDSDVDPATGETSIIEITSQDTDEEMMWDAGVYQNVTISGTVFYDDDMSNTQNGTEVGPAGVLVNLFNADNGFKVDFALTTAGVYEFPSNPNVVLPPGNYYVEIDPTSFAGVLSGAEPCPGSNDANDMVDNDDNGSDGIPAQSTAFTVLSNCDPTTPPEVEYVDFCYFFNCNTPNALAATACDEIGDPEIICDISTLTSFCAIMPSTNSGGNQPPQLCPNGGAPHNISWFAFVAYGGTYTVTVTPTNCSGSTTNQEGVQIGLYTDCTFTEAVYCEPGCFTDPVSFDSSVLEEGQTYYFFIDGCSGSVCSYEVDITGTPVPPNIQPTDLCIDNGGIIECTDGNTYCPNADVNFLVQGVELTANYSWSISTVSGTPFAGDPNPMTEDEMLAVNFSTEGEYSICINNINNPCLNWNGNICRTIIIAGLDDEEFDTQELCDIADFDPATLMDAAATNPVDPNGDATIGWQDPSTTFAIGTNTAMITTAQGCEYEQEVELALYPVSDVGLFEMVLCRDDLPIVIDGTQYTETTFGGDLTFSLPGIPLVNEVDVNGCDSIIDIELEILDIFMGDLSQGLCLTEGILLNFEYGLPPSFPSTDALYITFEWTDPNGNVLVDGWNPDNELDNVAPPDIGSGTYTLTATITKDGTTCVFPYTIDIDFESLAPQTPTITGSPMTICESDSIQTYTATDFGSADSYMWDVPAGVPILSGGGINDQTVEVNWAGFTGGTISLTGSNECGDSQPASIDITLVSLLTPAFTATAEVCQNSPATIMYSGPTGDIDSYIWSFDGGTIVTGGTGPGPHEISWSDVGDHTITLTVMHNNGCTSTETFEIVNTIAPTPITLNQCTSSSGQVVFTWDLTPGTVEGDYSVVVTTGQSGTLSGTTYTIDGLGANEVVDITLTLLSGDACVSTTELGSCVAQDCTPPEVSITTPETGPFCLNGTDQSFDLSAVIPAGVPGSGTYSGDGVTDVDAGTFDPDAAGPGTHVVSYTYQTDDGCTALAVPLTFVVNESPMAMFSSVDTICILDAFDITYSGTTGSLTTYTTDDGQSVNDLEPSIAFSTPGEHTITLAVEKDGCPSLTPFTKTVFVEAELAQISVNCTTQEIDNVAFGWDPVVGATGYLLTITNADGSTIGPVPTNDVFYAQGGLNPNDSISITVEVVSDSRCPVSSDTQKCYAKACPTVDVTIDAIPMDYCINGSNGIIDLTAVVDGDGDDSGVLVWSGDGVTGSQFDPNGLSEGAANISVEYIENGCGGYSDNITVNILQEPTASFDVATDPICIGSTIPITFTGSNLPGQTIDWSGSDVTVTATANPNEYEATFNTVGSFDIMVDVTNGVNCSNTSAPISISVEPELSFGAVDCVPSETEVSFSWDAVDCATDYEVFLTVGAGAETSQGIQSTTTFLADNMPEGTEVSIRVVAISDCACDDVMMTRSCETSACVQVTLDVSAMGGVTDFCFASDLATIDVLAELMNTSEGSGAYSGAGVDPISGTFDPIAAGVGSHTILYTWIEPFGCEDFVDSVTFNIYENPEVAASADPIDCYEDSLTMLTIIPMNGDQNYTITSDGEVIPLISEVMEGTYDIMVVDGNNCSAETSVTVTIPAEPMPTITGSTELIVGETSNYSIEQSIFTGLAIDSVVWTSNGTIVCNEVGCFSLSNEDPIVNTTYEVTVFYNNGCSVTTSIDVEVTEPDPIFTVDIPNIISPNSDGENDTWSIVTGDPEVSVNSVQIMDRWGNLVFELTAPYKPAETTIIWDGKFGTSDLQPGVYVYSVRYIQDDRERVRNGDITIVR